MLLHLAPAFLKGGHGCPTVEKATMLTLVALIVPSSFVSSFSSPSLSPLSILLSSNTSHATIASLRSPRRNDSPSHGPSSLLTQPNEQPTDRPNFPYSTHYIGWVPLDMYRTALDAHRQPAAEDHDDETSKKNVKSWSRLFYQQAQMQT